MAIMCVVWLKHSGIVSMQADLGLAAKTGLRNDRTALAMVECAAAAQLGPNCCFGAPADQLFIILDMPAGPWAPLRFLLEGDIAPYGILGMTVFACMFASLTEWPGQVTQVRAQQQVHLQGLCGVGPAATARRKQLYVCSR